MPAIETYNSSLEDFMPSSALSVSPILTASLFDEITNSPGTAALAISDTNRLRLLSTETRLLQPPRWRSRQPPRPTIDTQDQSDHINHIGPVTSRFMYNQNCINERAVDTGPLCNDLNHMLDFDVVSDDGGQYGAMYGIENILSNDGSVYCSGRKGVVNILSQYCGFVESGLISDTSCSISKMVIKAPQHGFTAPCKEGLIFVTHKKINVFETTYFDNFTKEQYDNYVQEKQSHNGRLDVTDPVACIFLFKSLNFRSGKFVLIKLLRADQESDNIDMQYIGFIGHAGARSFGCAKLC
ncbi:hypothetical protein INT48_001790 [Thamnidium elegans]|uniref:Uncharacterized protein n=1 Tax=Thamnidium elegans TaxID=101142 RepID=A0A8H7W201_9FUNG|nr:hypothetical protein INT48_001790 [Thamnidium elegans]